MTEARAIHCEKPTEAERRWLEATLEEGEGLVAWLAISKVAAPAGVELPAGKRAQRFLLTTRRAAVVSVPTGGAEGEVWAGWIERGEGFRVGGLLGAAEVRAGGFRFRGSLTNERGFREIAPLVELPEAQRRRAAALLNIQKGGGKGRGSAAASALLEASEEPLDVLFAALARSAAAGGRVELGGLPWPALREALGRERGGEAVASWARDLGLGPTEQLALVELALDRGRDDAGALAAALPLHEQARRAFLEVERGALLRAVVDLSYSTHLLRAGARREAARVAEAALAALPDEALVDLLPPRELDLTERSPRALRVALLEVLADARGEGGARDLRAVIELARLQPLVAGPVGELARVAEGSLRARAKALARLLAPDGLSSPEALAGAEAPRPRPVRPLPPDAVDRVLPHSAARGGGAVDWLRERLGRERRPDHAALRAYAERVTEKTWPDVLDLLADAALLLGVRGLEAFVSRGEQGLGLRVYEGPPPFLLLGAEHLDPSSDAFLRPGALAFAVGAEVAHLRLGHSRLTSSDVWDGAFHKGTRLVEVAAAFAGPLGLVGSAAAQLARLAAIQGILRGVSQVSTGVGRTAELVGYAKSLRRAGRGEAAAPRPEIGQGHGELLAASRLLQLTADRAGLLLCGNLVAATEAILLTSGDLRAELPLARSRGIVVALGRRDAKGGLLHQDLALRLAAVCGFFLSDEHESLRAAAFDEAAGLP